MWPLVVLLLSLSGSRSELAEEGFCLDEHCSTGTGTGTGTIRIGNWLANGDS